MPKPPFIDKDFGYRGFSSGGEWCYVYIKKNDRTEWEWINDHDHGISTIDGIDGPIGRIIPSAK